MHTIFIFLALLAMGMAYPMVSYSSTPSSVPLLSDADFFSDRNSDETQVYDDNFTNLYPDDPEDHTAPEREEDYDENPEAETNVYDDNFTNLYPDDLEDHTAPEREEDYDENPEAGYDLFTTPPEITTYGDYFT